MASIEQLFTALNNADAAGDVVAARGIADAIRAMQGGTARDMEMPPMASVRERDPSESGFLENIATGFGAGAVGMGEAASLGAAALLEEESELAVREKIKATADYLRPEGGDPDSIAYKLASGIGSIAGIAAPAAAAAFAAPASAVTAAGLGVAGALGVGAGAGEASERARAAGATEEERGSATLRGAAIGSLDVLPIGRIIKIPGVTDLMEKLGGDAVGLINRFRKMAVTGTAEGVQEASTAILQNLNERGYNAEAELVNAGVVEEGAIGAGSGAILQGFVDLFVKGKSAKAVDPTAGEPPLLGPALKDAPDYDQPTLEEGQVQGELFANRAEPITAEQGTASGSSLTDFAEEQISAAVTKLESDGVDPKAITEDMVFDTIVETPELRSLAAQDGRSLTDFSEEQVNVAVAQLEAEGLDPKAITEDMVFDTIVETPELRSPTVRDDRTPDMFGLGDMEAQAAERELTDAEIAEYADSMKADEAAVADLAAMRGESVRETETATAKDTARVEQCQPRT